MNYLEIAPEDMTVTLNGVALKIISLQKVYETGKNYTMPSYLVQTERPDSSAAFRKRERFEIRKRLLFFKT
ncbi:MAG: hypothetical protein K2N94_10525 [Lachnospiraceae bacterium]|nr:hypothetical protein [Lachnospiraceae bacterium]